MNPPLILITNDDGWASPGLAAAIRALCDLGELLIVAPVRQQSGMGRSLPGDSSCAITPRSLEVDGVLYTAYAIDGTPAQAVLHGILELAERPPALVVAGINHGENLGTSAFVSGTVGAALQAGDMGVPGLAVSLEVPVAFHFNHHSGDRIDWSVAVHFTRRFAEGMLTRGLPARVQAIKVDIPATATPRTPWRVTRQSMQSYYRSIPHKEMRFGVPRRLAYEVHIEWDRLEPDSDIWAFTRDRVVSVTPLTLDLTAHVDWAELAGVWAEGSPDAGRAPSG